MLVLTRIWHPAGSAMAPPASPPSKVPNFPEERTDIWMGRLGSSVTLTRSAPFRMIGHVSRKPLTNAPGSSEAFPLVP
jgi:hypothetical protein